MWAVLAFTSAIFYTVMWGAMRASRGIPVIIVQISYTLFAPILLVVHHGPPMPWHEPIWWIYVVWVSIVNIPFSWMHTYSVQRTDVTVSKPISAFSSIIAMFVGWFAFDISLPPFAIFGITAGFVGMWLLYHARWTVWKEPYPWMLILCIISFSITSVLITEVLKIYDDVLVVTGISLFGPFCLWVCIAAVKHIHWRPTSSMLVILATIAIATVIQEVAMTLAMTSAPAAYVISVKRTSIIMAAFVGYFFFHEKKVPLWRLVAATAIVTVSVACLAVR